MQAQLMGEKLWVLTIGGPARQLTDDPAYRDEHPVWSRDGQSILFARIDSAGKASVWQIPAAGGQPELVQDGLGFGQTGVGGLYGWIEWSDLVAWWQP
jgi:Tol biopolymer transport system component